MTTAVVSTVVGRGRLLERDAELARLFELVDAVGDGRFASAVIEGPAGAGKTELLQALAARAGERGIRLLRASGLELERGYPFGGVRQLLEPAVADLPPAARSEIFAGVAAVAEPLIGAAGGGEEAVGDEFSLLNGLYWCWVWVRWPLWWTTFSGATRNRFVFWPSR
jgi:predicted ATPase